MTREGIVIRAVPLALIFCATVAFARLPAAEDDPAPGHLDPAQTIARFLALTQSGKTADIRTAGRMIEADRGDLAWANDQLDSTSRDMLTTMHVYNFATILDQDPPVGKPVYGLHRETPVLLPGEKSRPADENNLDSLLTVENPDTAVPAGPEQPQVTEAQAERARLRLESGRTIDFVKSPAGVWLFDQRSSSLQARAEWVANRDRDLALPATKQFAGFYLDMTAHDPDYAWRVAMALGEAGRFVDLGMLIQFPHPPMPGPEADPTARAAAEKTRQARLEEQGRLLYSWLRRSTPRRVRSEASHLQLPGDPSKLPAKLPTVEGWVANFVIWTTDHKRVRLLARQRPLPADAIDLGIPVYEWVFDCDCYSPETKRAWIHAQRQSLPDQP